MSLGLESMSLRRCGHCKSPVPSPESSVRLTGRRRARGPLEPLFLSPVRAWHLYQVNAVVGQAYLLSGLDPAPGFLLLDPTPMLLLVLVLVLVQAQVLAPALVLVLFLPKRG